MRDDRGAKERRNLPPTLGSGSEARASDGPSPQPPPRAFRFDRYTLDLERVSLRRGGEQIELRPKSFDVLSYLAANAGRVVSKDEIFAAVWPDVTVTDDSLVQCVREIRRALQDDEQRLIKTIPRRGYLLDEPVCRVTEPESAHDAVGRSVAGGSKASPGAARPRRPTRLVVAAASLVAGVAMIAVWAFGPHGRGLPQAEGPPAVAVLFKSVGQGGADEPMHDYFSDGLTDDVIAALSRFSSLRVLTRTSLNPLDGKDHELRDLSRDLKVRYIVDGSVRRSEERVRVTARLTDATRGVLLWSEVYDEPFKDIFALQDRIARSVVGRLAVQIGRIEQERAAAKPTSNMEAYDYVLRGRDRLGRLTRTDNIEARRLFKTASELDPGYAAAFVGLGLSYLDDMNLGWTDRPEEAARRAYEFGHRAITLDDQDGGGHLLLAQVYLMHKQHGLALAETDRAIDLNPNDADGHAVRGMVLIWSGRPKEAIASFDTAARFDPSYTRPRSLVNMGMAHLLEGRLEEAARALELSTGRNPEFVFGYIGLAVAYHELGKHVESERAAATVRRLDPFFASARFGTLFANEADRLRMVNRLSRAGL